MLHRHDPVELYSVRSGELAIYVAGSDGAVRRTVAGPGTVVPIAGGLEHTVRNESDRDAEAVVVFAPGEPMVRFVRAAGAHDDPLALSRAHGIEVTRPIEDALASSPDSAGYLTIARFPGDRDHLLDQYREHSDAMSAVGRDHGLVLHAAARTDDGFLMVNLWSSRAASEAAARDPRRQRVVERVGVTLDQVQREHHEVAYCAWGAS
jgi:quinol monooxygenase YgiN